MSMSSGPIIRKAQRNNLCKQEVSMLVQHQQHLHFALFSKPRTWFRHVHCIFCVWPHGSETPRNISAELDQYNSLPSSCSNQKHVPSYISTFCFETKQGGSSLRIMFRQMLCVLERMKQLDRNNLHLLPQDHKQRYSFK